MPTRRLPLWLKLAYTGWMAVWVPAYWKAYGPVNFLWFCDAANFVVAVAVWIESSLLFSSQLVGVLAIQIAWMIDAGGRLLLGFHPIGGTEYMFDPAKPLALRLLSLFHLAMPALLVWGCWRLGYDRRGLRLQTALTWVLLPASFLAAEPEANINWLWRPFGVPQEVVPPVVYLLVCMLLYPLLVYLPTHLLVARWMRRHGRVPTGSRRHPRDGSA